MRKVWFDGGCKPNPGKMEIAAVIDNGPRQHDRIGHGTNNEAEWIALLLAANLARANGITSPHFIGDSNMIVNQASGLWQSREKWAPYKVLFDEAVHSFETWMVTQVPRAENVAGHYIEEMN